MCIPHLATLNEPSIMDSYREEGLAQFGFCSRNSSSSRSDVSSIVLAQVLNYSRYH